MTPTEIKTLILSDAVALSLFTASDDFECAQRITAIAPKTRGPISASELQYYAAINGIWAKIRLAAMGNTADSVKGVCLTIIDWVSAGKAIDVDLPPVKDMLTALVEWSIVDQTQYGEILSLANQAQTITALEVEYVRTRI